MSENNLVDLGEYDAEIKHQQAVQWLARAIPAPVKFAAVVDPQNPDVDGCYCSLRNQITIMSRADHERATRERGEGMPWIAVLVHEAAHSTMWLTDRWQWGVTAALADEIGPLQALEEAVAFLVTAKFAHKLGYDGAEAERCAKLALHGAPAVIQLRAAHLAAQAASVLEHCAEKMPSRPFDDDLKRLAYAN